MDLWLELFLDIIVLFVAFAVGYLFGYDDAKKEFLRRKK